MPQPVAMLWTIAIEAPLAFFLARRLGWGSGWRAAAVAAGGVAATHFFAWSAILQLEPIAPYLAAVGLVETAVMLAKSALYRAFLPLSWRRSLLFAGALNTTSTTAGLLYYAILF